MADDGLQRKLRAILSADVKGYSLLMADDEVLTLKTLNEYRDIMSELIQSNSVASTIIFGVAELLSSAIASTAILMQSKSERFPNGLGNDSGELGHNIMDHHLNVGAYKQHFLHIIVNNPSYLVVFGNLYKFRLDPFRLQHHGFQGLLQVLPPLFG